LTDTERETVRERAQVGRSRSSLPRSRELKAGLDQRALRPLP